MIEYLGKPWIAGAIGPDAFDCWGLLVHIYKNKLGIELVTNSDIDRNSYLAIASVTKEEFDNKWHFLEKPKHFCAVGLSYIPKKIFHVGCYLDIDNGYIIHSQRKTGCIIEPVSKIISNWKYISYYGLHSTR